MTSPIERMIDAVAKCGICGAAAAARCSCWVRCRCGISRPRTEAVCRNAATHDDYDARTINCVCSAPFATGRACSDSRGLKTPCRCACHRTGIRRAHERLVEAGERVASDHADVLREMTDAPRGA